MDGVTVMSSGRTGVLLVLRGPADNGRMRGLLAAMDARCLGGLIDVVPGEEAILLEFAERPPFGAIAELVDSARAVVADEARVVEIPVVYDGADLRELSDRLGLAADEMVARHAGTTYDVRMIGFAPGFPYLGPLDPALRVPRRATPRVRIPAGAVAIGGRYTGIYSVASAGGWHLIGTARVPVFRPELCGGAGDCGAFLLRAGDRVRFVPE